jgi:hypothetical protein
MDQSMLDKPDDSEFSPLEVPSPLPHTGPRIFPCALSQLYSTPVCPDVAWKLAVRIPSPLKSEPLPVTLPSAGCFEEVRRVSTFLLGVAKDIYLSQRLVEGAGRSAQFPARHAHFRLRAAEPARPGGAAPEPQAAGAASAASPPPAAGMSSRSAPAGAILPACCSLPCMRRWGPCRCMAEPLCHASLWGTRTHTGEAPVGEWRMAGAPVPKKSALCCHGEANLRSCHAGRCSAPVPCCHAADVPCSAGSGPGVRQKAAGPAASEVDMFRSSRPVNLNHNVAVRTARPHVGTNRIQFVLSGIQNRTSGPYSAA